MKIIVKQHGLELGPYTLQEAKDLLTAGMLEEADLARSEEGNDWVPLKDIILHLLPSPPISKDKAAPTTPVGSQPRVNPLMAKARSRLTSPAGSPPASASPASKEKAAPTAPAGSQPRVNPLLAKSRDRSAAAAAAKASEVHPVAVKFLVGAGILILIPVLVMVLAPDEVANLLEPVIKTGLTSAHPRPTETVDGDSVATTMTTDNSGDNLRSEVLDYIYAAAKDKPFLNHVTLTVSGTGTPTPKKVVIKVDNLDAVRAFADKAAYAASDARKVIDDDLTAAGL